MYLRIQVLFVLGYSRIQLMRLTVYYLGMAEPVIDLDEIVDEEGQVDPSELGRQISSLDDEELLVFHDRLMDVNMNVMIEVRERGLEIVDEGPWGEGGVTVCRLALGQPLTHF
jgi:hypothetical protein